MCLEPLLASPFCHAVDNLLICWHPLVVRGKNEELGGEVGE